MNFLQKNLIRIKPNIIFNKILFPTIDADILEFALENGLQLLNEKSKNLVELFENETYFTQLINKSDNITSKLGAIAAKDSNVKRKLINMLNSSNIKISELPNSILECPGVVESLCNRNIDEVLDFLSSDNNKRSLTSSFIVKEVKEFILSNPLENIKYLERCTEIFKWSIGFTSEETSVLKKACIQSNYVISDKSPSFFKTDEILLNSIMNAKTPEQINNLKASTRNWDFSSGKFKEDEKIVKAIVSKIKEMGYVYYPGISPQFIISNNEFILALVENDPYTIDELGFGTLNSIISDNIKSKIVESLKKNNYVFSERVVNHLLIDDPDILLDSFDINFDDFQEIPFVPTKYSNEEKVAFLQREYNIIKEHDPEFSAKTYNFWSNPYVFKELILRGKIDIKNIGNYVISSIPAIEEIAPFLKRYYKKNNIYISQEMKNLFSMVPDMEDEENITKSNIQMENTNNDTTEYQSDYTISINMSKDERERAINSKKLFLTSIKNNIYTLYFYYQDYSFTELEKKEIAEVYLKGYPETLKNFLGNRESLPKIILNNPYIQYELLHKNPELRLDIDPIKEQKLITNDEIDSNVYEDFINENKELNENSTIHEKSNKRIVLKSIEENPNILQFISKSLYSDNEIYEIINRKILEGTYKINENTPDLFILKNYSKLKENNLINIDEIIKKNPKLLRLSNSKLKNEVRDSLPNQFRDKEITVDELIQYVDAIDFHDYDATQYVNIIHSNPQIINKLSNIENSPLYNSQILDAIFNEFKNNKNLSLDKNTFNKLWENSLDFRKYVRNERADLFPWIPSYYLGRDEQEILLREIENGNLKFKQEIKEEYFPVKLFDSISINDYNKIVETLTLQDPQNIFMLSSRTYEQDEILYKKYKELIENKKISYNMPGFKVPLFANSRVQKEEILNALKANPNIINLKNLKWEDLLYKLTKEQKDIIKMAIEESLDTSKELPKELKEKPDFFEALINKDINLVTQISSSYEHSLYPLMEMYFSRNQIKYDDNLPDFLKKFYRTKYIDSGYPPPEKLKTVLNTFFSDQIRDNPELVREFSYWASEEGFIISEDDSIAIKTNTNLIIRNIEQDVFFVYNLNQFYANITEDFITLDSIINRLIKSDKFQYKEGLPEFLKNSTRLFIHAIEKDINNRRFFNENKLDKNKDEISYSQIETIKNIYLQNNIYLQDTRFAPLAQIPEYVFESLEHANEDDIQKIIDLVDLNSFDNVSREKLYNMVATYIDDGLYTFSDKSNPLFLLSDEIAKKAILNDITILKRINQDDIVFSMKYYKDVYDKFKANKAKYSKDIELMEIIKKNPYFIAEQAFNDIENIDNYNFEGIYIEQDFIKEISNKLLEVNYKVTENTPKFVLMNKDFLINYIKKQKSIENIPEKYVINLFAKDDIIQNDELMEIVKYTVNLKTPFTRYIANWGIDLWQQLYEEFGQFLKQLDPSKKYTLEGARADLIKWMYTNINDLSEDEVYSFYTKLKPEVKEKDFETYIMLCNSDTFMKYAIKQNPNFLYKYTGKNEDLLLLAKDLPESELNKYLLKVNFATSTKLMSSLVKEKNPDFIRYYKGRDVSVVSLAMENGLFENKNEEYINQILEEATVICHSDDAIKYLIENYNVNYIEKYTGNNESITQLALDKGYIPTLDSLLNNSNLLYNNIMLQRAIKKDIYCNGLVYNGYSDSEKLEIVKQIIGEETYTKIFKNEDANNNLAYTNIEREFINLTSIIKSKEEGVQFLKLLDKDLINEVGFKEWKKIVKYSFNNEKLEYLQNVLNKSEVKTLLKFIKQVYPLIKDNSALGVNKFLTITRFYDLNPVFCKSLLDRIEKKQELTDIELVNLETLIYREDQNSINIKASSLKNLIEIEQRQLLEKTTSCSKENKIFAFLFNMSEEDISKFLSKTLNSRTIAQIRSRAIEEKNKKLLIEADYMGIVIDIIENIKYNYSDKDLTNLLNILAKVPQSEIIKIRKNFGNIPEMARHFYEIEAQEELTDIQDIIKSNPKLLSEYKGVKIVDLSHQKHTVYAHVYSGNSFEKLFNTEYGKVTICVSVETDKHEAYYYSDSPDYNVVLFFNKIPNGSYVGSSPQNMGSNGYINNNDYEVKDTKIFNQKSIRESYFQHGHSETLLYRYDLVPSGLIINKVPPSEYQIEKLNKLQEEVRKIKGHENDTLYFIKTQGNNERTIDYEENKSKEKMDADVEEIEIKIQQLRKNFFGLVNIDKSNNQFIREVDGERYTIIDGEVFEEANLTEEEQENLKLAAKLEEIVHQDNKKAVIKYKTVKDESKERLLKAELTDSRTLLNLKRKNAHFSEGTLDILLGEFLIDHLMCNYSVGNNDFVLNPYNTIQSTNKNGVLENVEDFISHDGRPHTEMSYYYYTNCINNHGINANNVYRKIFENYINNPNIDETISETLFNNMKKAARNISIIPTEKYMKMYKNILQNIEDPDKRAKAERLIRARKENIIKDTEEFIDILKSKRELAQNIEKIESADTVALINDIHGNASALEEILKKCIEDGKKDVFVLGDMIGFGAESNKCLDILRTKFPSLNIRCILGNHELYSLMGNSSFERKLDQRELEHTTQIRKDISIENRKFLESLPITRKVEIDGKTIELTHFPIKEEFQNDNDMYHPHGSSLQSSSTDFVIYGHEHRTESTSGDDVGSLHVYNTGNTTFINLPSSGCVHGKNTTYGIINTNNDDLQVSVIPLSYDKKRNDEAIRKTNNPYPQFFGTKNCDMGTR